jgi:hypothetical protein
MRLNYELYYLTPVDQIPVRVKIFDERSSQFGLSIGKKINIPNSGFSLTPIIGLRLVRNHSLRWPTNDMPDINRIFEYHKSENDTMYMWGFVYSYEKIYPLQSTGLRICYSKNDVWNFNFSCIYNHSFYPIIETELLIDNEGRDNDVFYGFLYNKGSFISFQFGLSYSLNNLIVENPKN